MPGLILLAACNRERGGTPAGESRGIVDNEVRGYIEQSLRPYLTSMAKTACGVRAKATPKSGRYGLCVPSTKAEGVESLDDPKAEGVTIPPKDGKPFPRPDTARSKADTIDNEVSGYIEDKLLPYLGSLAKVICGVRRSAAREMGDYGTCGASARGQRARSPTGEAAETLPPPPKNRKVLPAPVTVPVGPDNEVRTYIEKDLRPYLTTLSKVACGTRASAAPKVARYGVCVPYSPGATGVEQLEGDPKGEGVTIPPKNGRPFPLPDEGRPGPGNPPQ
jgi:hypothetical protein